MVRADRVAGRPGGQQLGEAGVLLRLRTEDLAHPAERHGRVDLGAPAEHLLDVEPVLRAVEDGLADDEVLGGEDRDVDRAEADQRGPRSAISRWRSMVAKNTSRYEPSQSSLACPSTGDDRPVLGRDRHAEAGQHPEDRLGRLGRQGQVHVDVGRRPGVAVPGQGDGPAELVRHAERVEHLVERDDLASEVAERCRSRRRSQVGAVVARCRAPCAARRRARGGNRSGSGRAAGLNGRDLGDEVRAGR